MNLLLIMTILKMFWLPITIVVLVIYLFLGYKTPRLAIISLPFIVSVLFIFSASEEMFSEAMISLSILFTTLFAILFSKHEIDIVPWPKRAAKTALVIFLIIFLTISLPILSFPIGTVFIGFVGIFLGYLIGAGWTQKNYTLIYVVSTIGASMRQNLPLPMALQSTAENLNYQHSQILRQISKWLVQGYSLSESIKRGFKKCPAKITALIGAGERVGQIPQVMQSIEDDLLEKANDSKRIKPIYPSAYFFTVMVVISLVLLFVMTGVVPKFSMVIKDMSNSELPWSTKFLVSASNFVTFRWGWTAIVIPLIIIGLINIRVRTRPRRPERPRLLSRIGDFIKWNLPIFRWFENNYSTLQVLEVLRISLNSGSTVNQAIHNTIDLDVNCQYRKKLQKWLRLVEAGENITSSIKKSGLPQSLMMAFEQNGNSENTINVLEMLESVYRSNYSFRINLAKFILLPCTTIMLGSVVGFVAYSILSAMVKILTVCSNLV